MCFKGGGEGYWAIYITLRQFPPKSPFLASNDTVPASIHFRPWTQWKKEVKWQNQILVPFFPQPCHLLLILISPAVILKVLSPLNLVEKQWNIWRKKSKVAVFPPCIAARYTCYAVHGSMYALGSLQWTFSVYKRVKCNMDVCLLLTIWVGCVCCGLCCV